MQSWSEQSEGCALCKLAGAWWQQGQASSCSERPKTPKNKIEVIEQFFVFSECGSCRPAAPLALGAAYASCRSCAQLRLPWCYVIKETGARRPPARKTRRKTVRARKRSFRFVICVFWLFHRTRRTCECAREFSRVRVCLLARGRAEE